MLTTSKPPLLARPRDESLQAFKDWINEFYRYLTGKTETDDSITEQQWADFHRKFWEELTRVASEEGETNA